MKATYSQQISADEGETKVSFGEIRISSRADCSKNFKLYSVCGIMTQPKARKYTRLRIGIAAGETTSEQTRELARGVDINFSREEMSMDLDLTHKRPIVTAVSLGKIRRDTALRIIQVMAENYNALIENKVLGAF